MSAGLVRQQDWAFAAAELVRSVNRDDPVTEVISHIAAQALKLLDLDMCAVMIPNEEQDRLLVAGSAGFAEEYIRELNSERPLLLDRSGTRVLSPTAQAFVQGDIISIPDIDAAPSMSQWREPAQTAGYRSLVAAPLSWDDRIAGVLVGYSKELREYPVDQIDLLAMFAVHAGATIQSAYRRDELRGTIAQLHEANSALRAQSSKLEKIDQHHRKLMEVMANDVGMSGVVSMLAEVLKCSVVLEDPQGRVLATAGSGGQLPLPSAEVRVQTEVAAALDQAIVRHPRPVRAVADEEESMVRWVAAVMLNRELVAWLWVGSSRFEMGELGHPALERFALALSLEFAKQRSALQMRLRLSRELMGDLLSKVKDSDREAVFERAAALGHDLRQPHRVIVLAADSPAPAGAPRGTLVEASDRVIRSAVPAALSGGIRGEAVVLLPTSAGADDRSVAEWIVAEFRRRSPGRTASAVIGPVAEDVAEILRVYQATRGALALLRTRRSGAVEEIGDFGVASLLLSHGDPEMLVSYSDRLLLPLDQLDAPRSSELLETLTVWLEEDRSTRATAERLLVHVNTVTYRLKSIEERLQRSLRDATFLTEVQMALAIRRVAGALSRN